MAWFTFTDVSGGTFLVRLTDPDLVAHARGLVDGSITADARIGGTIEKAPAAYNIGWSFHLNPKSIFFFEMSTEVGDSTMAYLEAHLPEVGGHLLPGRVWTPWSSEMGAEVLAKRGTGADDLLLGTAGADLLFGFASDDILRGRRGDDHLVGGSGRDRLFGEGGDDKLSGGPGDDILAGGLGYDLLLGGGGDDVLRGGPGNDVMAGGPGSDIFHFTDHALNGRDRVRDFGPDDRLAFDRSWLDAVGDRTGDGRLDAEDIAAAFFVRGADLVLAINGDNGFRLEGAAAEGITADEILLW